MKTELFEIETKPSRGGARVSSGRDSKQDYVTPQELIRSVEKKFGKIEVDLAATMLNRRTSAFIDERQDALSEEWQWHKLGKGWLWLNPPFKFITPWAKKCSEQMRLGAKILLLTPASVDSNWWDAYVHETAHVHFLQPRVQFDGADDPFMKPLALSVFWQHAPESMKWYQPWRWK